MSAWENANGFVYRRGYGRFVFQEEREFTEDNWTDEQLRVLEQATEALAEFLNRAWPKAAKPAWELAEELERYRELPF